MSFSKLLPVVMLAAILVLGVSFLTQTLGSVEKGQDPNLSQTFKDQVNGTRDTSIITISTAKLIAPILGALALIVAISWILKTSKSKRRRY